MKKKIIEELIGLSYRRLDQKKVNTIASVLSAKDLKQYINKLKSSEKESTLTISSCGTMNSQDLKKIVKFFPNKKVVVEKDPSLMLGVRITDDDVVYDFTLKNSLHKILNYVEQNYD